MRDERTVKMSQHITGLPKNLYETHRKRVQIQENLVNNSRFYDFTHTDLSKQSMKENVDINNLCKLP